MQANAEQAVRELLRDFSKSQNLKEVDTVSAEEHMDDGTPIHLAVTIDRRDGSALLDFEGLLCMMRMLSSLMQRARQAVLPDMGRCACFAAWYRV